MRPEDTGGLPMRVEVGNISEGIADDILRSFPVAMKGLKERDPVRVNATEIGDWACNHGMQTFGSFTDAILRKRLG